MTLAAYHVACNETATIATRMLNADVPFEHVEAYARGASDAILTLAVEDTEISTDVFLTITNATQQIIDNIKEYHK